MEGGFAFVIDQIVTLKVCPQARLHIVGLLQEVCPGGVQRHYQCRAAWEPKFQQDAPYTHSTLYKYNEIELRALTDAESDNDIAQQCYDLAQGVKESTLQGSLFELAAQVRDAMRKAKAAKAE